MMQQLLNKRRVLINQGGGFDFTTRLVASWQFENNFNDYTGNHNASVYGNVTNNTPGKVGNKAYYDGNIGSYLSVLNHSDLTFIDGINDVPFTFSLWVNPLDTGLREVFVKGSASNKIEYLAYTYLRNFYFTLYGGSTIYRLTVRTPSMLVDGILNHVVITYTGNKLANGFKISINGVNQILSESGQNYTGMIAKPGGLSIGKKLFYNSFYGSFDEIKIYKSRILTALEITEMYNQELAGNSVLP